MNQSDIADLIAQESLEAHKRNYDWIRHGISVLTPSLTLLIGLQEPSQPCVSLKCVSLLVTVVLMTLTILTGLAALRCEAKLHFLRLQAYAEAGISSAPESAGIQKIELPKIYSWAVGLFPYLTFISIFSLGVFGLAKFIT